LKPRATVDLVVSPSQPPGFDMTYRPVEKFFGPPWRSRIFAIVHVLIAAALLTLVLVVENGPEDTSLYKYMFRQQRSMEASTAAGFFALSALLSIVRDSMRGVVIKRNWIEYRELVSAVWPRVRRYRWAQIDGIVLGSGGLVSLDVWDGRREILPAVRATDELRLALERIAAARAIPLRGGLENHDFEPDELPE